MTTPVVYKFVTFGSIIFSEFLTKFRTPYDAKPDPSVRVDFSTIIHYPTGEGSPPVEIHIVHLGEESLAGALANPATALLLKEAHGIVITYDSLDSNSARLSQLLRTADILQTYPHKPIAVCFRDRNDELFDRLPWLPGNNMYVLDQELNGASAAVRSMIRQIPAPTKQVGESLLDAPMSDKIYLDSLLLNARDRSIADKLKKLLIDEYVTIKDIRRILAAKTE